MKCVMPLLCLVLCLLGCSGLRQNQDPIADIQYYTTKELLDMRESLLTALQPYKGLPNDMTNRKQLTSLKDETAGIYKRKTAQIERELKRRYDAGDKTAAYVGMEGAVAPSTAVLPVPSATAPAVPATGGGQMP